ncbi:transcription and mRNA export factor ENY2 isoform X2 [Accipiter gentilis]|uniref:transcription and mRNA export factor ENY2 isoform X2 n=1 Tax=Astur gentilis TaxID=8957 RepID=UPI00210FEDB0|nr:transcription and mRNA export factor ENY2 isoform X2 [Accipiter gentilis]
MRLEGSVEGTLQRLCFLMDGLKDLKYRSWSSPDVIKEKGLEHVTVDDLVAEITPKGRALVPDSVKKELLQRIRTFLAQHASL